MSAQKTDVAKIIRVLTPNDVHWVVTKLMDCTELVKNMERLSGALGISQAELEDIRRINIHSAYTYGFLASVLTKWISKEKPSFKKFISILKQEDFNFAAGTLLDELKTRPSSSCQTTSQNQNSRILFDVRDPIDTFTGRGMELQQIKDNMNDGTMTFTVIAGLGGIGKSELARKYIQLNKENHDNIIWINADSHLSLVRSFKELAQNELDIKTKNIDGEEKSISYVVKEVYNSQLITNANNLLVFDNAEKYVSEPGGDGIVEFLPPKRESMFHILITSRSAQWGPIMKVCLPKEFTPDELEHLIDITIGKDRTLKRSDVKQLGVRLQYFPLAVQQAIAYIRQANEELRHLAQSGEYNISDYILEYESRTHEVLSFSFPDYINDKYAYTVSTTWEITFRKINEESDAAVRVLEAYSYLAPDSIPAELLTLDLDSRKLGTILRILKKYSMLNIDSEVSMHRLVQDVVRLKVEREGKQIKIFEKIFNDLRFSTGETKHENVQKRKLLIHIETFLSHVDNYMENIYSVNLEPRAMMISTSCRELKTLLGVAYLQLGHHIKARQLFEKQLLHLTQEHGEDDIRLTVAKENLARAYGRLGNYRKENEILAEVLETNVKHLGVDHVDNADIIRHLANSYGRLGDNRKKRDLMKLAIPLYEMKYGAEHIKVGKNLRYLGNAYSCLGANSKAKAILERALSIVTAYGVEHSEFGITLSNLGYINSCLGEHDTAKELLERALPMQTQHFGNDHYFTAKTLGDLGNAYSHLGDNIKAIGILEQAVSIIEKRFGHQHFHLGDVLMYLGNARAGMGDHVKALCLFERALDILENCYGCEHVKLVGLLDGLGRTYECLGEIQKKDELLSRISLIKRKQRVDSSASE